MRETIGDTVPRRAARLAVVVAMLVVLAACGGSARDAGPEPVPSPDATATVAPSPTAAPSPTPSPAVGSGVLDPSFGTGGVAVVSLRSMLAVARRSLFVRDDGRTSVLVLSSSDGGGSFALLRIDLPADGRLDDPASGVTQPLPELDALAAGFAADGSAIVFARAASDGIVAVRLTAGGAVDADFGDAGVVRTDLESAFDVLPLDDGRSIAIGRIGDRSVLLRLTADGAMDATFGVAGIVDLPPAPEPDDGGRYDLADVTVLPDGRVLAAATYHVAIASLPRLFAFSAAGELDGSFGDGGVLAPSMLWPTSFLTPGTDGMARWIIRDRILLVDERGALRGELPLRDTTYGAGFGAAVDTPAGLVLAGSSWVPDEPRRFICGSSSDGVCLRRGYAVQLVPITGTAPTGFGDDGVVVTDLPAPYGAQNTRAQVVVAAPEERLTVAGPACSSPFECDLVLLRYGAP